MSDLVGKVALVVDDDPDQIEFVTAILDENQVTSISASNGREALEKLAGAKPDIIFLDLMMPEQSGMKFFNEIKASETHRDIPVVIVSGASSVTGVDMKSLIYDESFAERKQKVFGTDATPDAYIEKPVDPEVLIETMRKLLAG
jgi:CheY-like chemotaxis protein